MALESLYSLIGHHGRDRVSETKNIKTEAKDEAENKLFYYPPEISSGYVVRIANQLLQHELHETLEFSGVGRGQWYFLRALWNEDGLTQRELSVQAGMMEPTTVVALNRMEKTKLIYRVRDAGDRRKIRVHLTESGRSLREKLLPLMKEINDRATVGISRKDLQTFHRVIAQITKNLRAPKD